MPCLFTGVGALDLEGQGVFIWKRQSHLSM